MPNQPNPRYDEYAAMQNATPTTPTPEPVIGPGMILERGRDRVVVMSRRYPDDNDWWVRKFKRSWLGVWPQNGEQAYLDAGHIRYLIMSGFRVVREGSK